jgi:hypothetical protein
VISRRVLLCLSAVLTAVAAGAPGRSNALAAASGPRAKAAEPSFDAGDIDDRAKVVHEFVVENTGDKPLQLTVARRSCSCEEVEAPADAIAPGKKGAVVFHWTPPLGTIGKNLVAADVATNDPQASLLRLELKSNVAPRIRIDPVVAYIDFETIRAGASAERVFKVFSTVYDSFDLDASLGGAGVELKKEPLKSGEKVDDVAVKSGYRLTLKATPKLAPGYYREDLTLKIKAPKEAERVSTLPVYALLNTDAFNVTPEQVNFEKPLGVKDEVKKVRVKFTNPTDKDAVEVVRTEPKFLQTSKPVKLEGGVWQFEVTLPKDAAGAKKYEIDAFFEGRVIFKTTAAEGETAVRVKWEPAEK